jgi:hypothetical protein
MPLGHSPAPPQKALLTWATQIYGQGLAGDELQHRIYSDSTRTLKDVVYYDYGLSACNKT